jgi:hypothetical protein
MSQLGQDKIVDEYLGGKGNGVFVDIGAYDGVTFSNTLMLERERGWTGICIEPLPDIFAELRKNRRCICVQACIGNREEQEVEFLAVQSEAARTRMLSGVLSEYDPRHLARVDVELNEFGGSKSVIRAPMRHLHGLLHEHGIGNVDYRSTRRPSCRVCDSRTMTRASDFYRPPAMGKSLSVSLSSASTTQSRQAWPATRP